MFTFTPPPSKSLTNRALVLAAIANGKSIISNYAICDDTIYMIRSLRKFGVKIIEKNSQLIVTGTGGSFKKDNLKIYCGNAGTTFRFLTTLSILNEGKVVLTGSKRMLQRPIGNLVDALKQLDVNIQSNNGYPPVVIEGGKFNEKKVTINPKVSSQFLSALLMLMPVIDKDFIVEIDGELPSIPYVKMTLQIMKKFGVVIEHNNFQLFKLKNNLKLSGTEIIIESDATSATYFFGAAAILRKSIRINGLSKNSSQADLKFIKVLEKMGCEVSWNKNSVTLKGKKLKGLTIDMNDAPDSVPTLAVVSLFAQGKTLIKNIGNLRYKESDRITALATEIRKIGFKVIAGEDYIEIEPSKFYQPASIETYNDHRIAMSFALCQLKIPGLEIKNPECVKKSFPNFWLEFNKMRENYKL